jgi:SAM-dependent methyltransferase
VTRPGLDHDFLAYIGYDPEVQKAHQRFYLPFFAGRGRVVDLGCGGGDFVELLLAQGVDAVGVDVDPVAVQSMQERGLPVVQQDALAYLDALAPESIDGVFAAHLVEHLPYKDVYELIERAYQALRPGGVIVLTTPDPRSLVAHLEMFYLHFGHETFYHPRLLCFFLERVGFVGPEFGSSDSPVQPQSPMFDLTEMHLIRARLPIWRQGLFWRFVRAVRMAVAYMFLNPYLDLIQGNFQRLAGALARVDRPFECYVKASKPVLGSGGIVEQSHH